jgi:hypothetical protein
MVMTASRALLGSVMFEGLGSPAAPFLYVPDLAPVGSKSSYFPRSVSNDAAALNFLGFLSDFDVGDLVPSMGSQSADMANEAGAWDPLFRGAVGRFQVFAGITNDTWIGPMTRSNIAAKVLQKNANPGIPTPSLPPTVPVAPGAVPALPTPIPGVHPASTTTDDNTTTYVAAGVAGLALLALGWYALS